MYYYIYEAQKTMRHGDIILRRQRIIILLNDCLWYGHADCAQGSVSVPDTGPRARRIRTIRRLNRKLWGRLTSKGWTVVINWKCELPGGAQSNTGKLTLPLFLIILLKEISRLKLLLLK